MDFKTANFLGAIIIGAFATLALVIAAATLGNTHALVGGLISFAAAYACQALVTYREFGISAIGQWPFVAQIISIISWAYALFVLVF